MGFLGFYYSTIIISIIAKYSNLEITWGDILDILQAVLE
jgi:hypothetical protein